MDPTPRLDPDVDHPVLVSGSTNNCFGGVFHGYGIIQIKTVPSWLASVLLGGGGLVRDLRC
jgi:hypothetical protein